MDRFDESIAYLRLTDAGKNGPLADAADCIEELLGNLHEVEQLAEDRRPVPASTPAQPPYPEDQRLYQTQAYKDGQSRFLLGAAMADKE